MPAVLFICTQNLFRSPIAAAYFLNELKKHNSDQKWVVSSAGTWTVPGRTPSPLVLQVARYLELGGLENHKSCLIDLELLEKYDLILVMEEGHKEAITLEFPQVRKKIYLLSEVVYNNTYDIPDLPGSFDEALVVASDLYNLIQQGYPRICKLAKSLQKG